MDEGHLMDTAQFWVSAALQLGVPTVALYLVAKWVSKRIEETDKAASEREKKITADAEKREIAAQERADTREAECRAENKKLTQDVRNLEREVRNELVPLIKDNQRALEHSTNTSRQFIALVHELTHHKLSISDGPSTDLSLDSGLGSPERSAGQEVRSQQVKG